MEGTHVPLAKMVRKDWRGYAMVVIVDIVMILKIKESSKRKICARNKRWMLV